MIKNVIFDLDGTVIDSSECIYKVYSALFREMKIPMPDGRSRRRLIGPPVETTLSGYINTDPSPYGKRFREIYSTVDLKSTNRLYEGIPELLEGLTEDGYRLFIATSKAENFAVKILTYLNVNDYFTAIYGSRYELDRTSKSRVLQAVIDDYGLNKEECILIGDTKFDYVGATEVGVRTGVVTYGFGEKEDFDEGKIAFFADTPYDVRKKIGGINNG